MEDTEIEFQRQRCLAKKCDEEKYGKTLKELELNRVISDRERDNRLELLKREYDQRLLERERKAEIAKLRHESERAEILAEIEDSRDRRESAKDILDRAREGQQRIEERLAFIEDGQRQIIEELANIKVAGGLDLDASRRMNTVKTSLSSGIMAFLGDTSSPSYLAQVLREKANRSSDSVEMTKLQTKLQTRDIGPEKVDTLAINSPLRFGFQCSRSGYATVLNVGTSGRLYVHSPSAHVGIQRAQVVPERMYQIPGPELFPSEDYFEQGPPGWEALFVIVSDEPLMAADELGDPFKPLTTPRVAQLIGQLADLPEDAWTVGVLGFLVQ